MVTIAFAVVTILFLRIFRSGPWDGGIYNVRDTQGRSAKPTLEHRISRHPTQLRKIVVAYVYMNCYKKLDFVVEIKMKSSERTIELGL
ncbi:hypothetical protein OZX73_03835 [Bifidobacterium sp. ESL0775]|uniref:hypothetical protein n=1 Tax=Bifidobacterium sp. ESL0775 TaxID=2983230 RepID=UPI0023F8C913|nr:hypothetical protein [Bifidobacterium sp. ESL0775]WEV69998.1 hypothetical protein OZX73_03835 [Bifidobacterium sp. ESL0775]